MDSMHNSLAPAPRAHCRPPFTRIGLTGGVGSGKSTVLEFLREFGAATADADAISREVTAAGGAAVPLIAKRFGPQYIASHGGVNRALMRTLVYADAAARRDLESIVHPLVAAELMRQAEAAQAAGMRCIVFDVPLLVEWGDAAVETDYVWVVDCEPNTQIARVRARSGLAEEEVRAIMAAQAPRAARLARADWVIHNEGITREALRVQVQQAARSVGLGT